MFCAVSVPMSAAVSKLEPWPPFQTKGKTSGDAFGVVTSVVAVPDARKGEQLVMFTTVGGLDRTLVAAGLRKAGVTELMVPKIVVALKELPLLGSGKTDYVALRTLMGRARPRLVESIPGTAGTGAPR